LGLEDLLLRELQERMIPISLKELQAEIARASCEGDNSGGKPG
jgi:hypothetical protein